MVQSLFQTQRVGLSALFFWLSVLLVALAPATSSRVPAPSSRWQDLEALERRQLLYDYDYIVKQPSPSPNNNNSVGFSSPVDKEVYKGSHPLAPDEVLTFLHIQHTGGTLLSLVLGATFPKEEVCPGSRISNSFFGQRLDDDTFQTKLRLWHCGSEEKQAQCHVAFFHEDYSFVRALKQADSLCTPAVVTWLRHPYSLRVSFQRSAVVPRHKFNEGSFSASDFETHVRKFFQLVGNATTLTQIPFVQLPRQEKSFNSLYPLQLNLVLGRHQETVYAFTQTNRFQQTEGAKRALRADSTTGATKHQRRLQRRKQGPDEYASLSEEEFLQRAIAQLDSFYFVGITEEMETSMCLLGLRLGRHLSFRNYRIRRSFKDANPNFELTNLTKEMLRTALWTELWAYEHAVQKLKLETKKVLHYATVHPEIAEFMRKDRWCHQANLSSP